MQFHFPHWGQEKLAILRSRKTGRICKSRSVGVIYWTLTNGWPGENADRRNMIAGAGDDVVTFVKSITDQNDHGPQTRRIHRPRPGRAMRSLHAPPDGPVGRRRGVVGGYGLADGNITICLLSNCARRALTRFPRPGRFQVVTEVGLMIILAASR